jgi:hypothetical protein
MEFKSCIDNIGSVQSKCNADWDEAWIASQDRELFSPSISAGMPNFIWFLYYVDIHILELPRNKVLSRAYGNCDASQPEVTLGNKWRCDAQLIADDNLDLRALLQQGIAEVEIPWG